MQVLQSIASIASVAHCPFISAPSTDLFGLDSWTELPDDLTGMQETVEYAAWREFRNTEESRYVGLTLPRVLARQPYGDGGLVCNAFNYDEGVDGSDHEAYLWTNAAYHFGENLTRAFAQTGFCVGILGMSDERGLVKSLPLHKLQNPRRRHQDERAHGAHAQ